MYVQKKIKDFMQRLNYYFFRINIVMKQKKIEFKIGNNHKHIHTHPSA